MKLQLNKKKLKNLSKDAKVLPEKMTRNIAGGINNSNGCTATVCAPVFDTGDKG